MKKKVRLDTFAKVIVTVVVVHGICLSSASYVLSSMGCDPVVEVSVTVLREIVAPVITYLVTNCIANIFEKNKLSFSEPLSLLHKDKEDEVAG